ncbi:MAG: Gfo/Idh/MocA family protein [Actinomycetota bacterium]
MSASQRPMIGIVGTGENARDHAAACRALSADLVAICDISAEALERFGNEFDCANRYQSLESLLDAHHLDVLIISAWGPHHAPLALQAMDSGRVRAVLVEKPMAMNAAEAAEMVNRSRETGTVLVEGFKWRYDPQHHAAFELLASGRIGAVRSVHGAFSAPLAGRAGADNWRFDPARGGGSLYDTASYLVHFARAAMNGDPISVMAVTPDATEGGAELSAAMILEFDEGRVALLQSSYTQAYHQSVTVIGAEGYLRYVIPFDSRSSRDAEFVTTPPLAARIDIHGNDFSLETLEFPPCNQFEAQLTAVFGALRTGGQVPASGEFAVGSMATLDALRTSIASGRKVAL